MKVFMNKDGKFLKFKISSTTPVTRSVMWVDLPDAEGFKGDVNKHNIDTYFPAIKKCSTLYCC